MWPVSEDYDSLLDSKPPYSPPYIHKTEKGQRVSFQTWGWNGDNYQLTQYIIDDEENLQIGKFVCEYRATRREELTNLLFIQWRQQGDLEIPGGIRILSTDCNCQEVKSSLPRLHLTLHQLLQCEACQTAEDHIAERPEIGNTVFVR